MSPSTRPGAVPPGLPGLPDPTDAPLAVLRIAHNAVVTGWRERERELRRRGIDVTLVSAWRWDEGGAPVTFDAAGDDFALAAKTLGHHPIRFVFDPRPIWRLLTTRRWDVLDVAEEPYSLATAEVLLLRRLARVRAPYVLYSAQNLHKRYPPPFRWSERWALARAAGVYACNRQACHVTEHKGLPVPATLVPLGVDVERFAPAPRHPPDGSLRVGYVGRLEPHKGVGVLLDALDGIDAVTVDIVGSGPEETKLRARAGRTPPGTVTFAGHVGFDELPGYYRSFDALAVPSVPRPGLEEQFCRVAVEAMASGVPVVASRVGAIPDVVGDAAVLVEPNEPAALRAALELLRDDPARWDALRRAGLRRAERFSWAAVADLQAALYRQAAARRGTAAAR